MDNLVYGPAILKVQIKKKKNKKRNIPTENLNRKFVNMEHDKPNDSNTRKSCMSSKRRENTKRK